ncbi:MAG: retron system putative HNH endonuclease, partial [bacterium]
AITKRPEPPSLVAHRKTPHCHYGNYGDKDELRHALVTEQRGICCYCMARIHNGHDTMKVEHWRCQDGYPSEQLNYRNLLGACRGGKGQPLHLQHCDTRKGDSDLHWNPADPAHHIETRVRYDPDGTIRSDDGAFDAELNTVLNLNLPVLKNNRKRVYDAVLDWWTSEKDSIRGPIPRKRLERKRDSQVAGNGMLSPYCQVAVWLLGQKLARMAP